MLDSITILPKNHRIAKETRRFLFIKKMARPIDPMMKSKDKKVVKGEKREWEMEKSWSTFNREGWG
jgi:hypothetical protein